MPRLLRHEDNFALSYGAAAIVDEYKFVSYSP